ncbi:MAG: hypothetical protein J1E95_10530 [Muribaculaceae bacterium]|nr:hypothetical protein [Muribaculaceae bacterium]
MKKISTNFGKRVLTMLGAVALMGAVSANAQGTPMGTFEADADTQTITAPSNGYLLLTYDSPVDMTGAGGAALFSHASYGPDMAISAIETNGEPTGTIEGAFSGYGDYTGYTNVTKALYEVTEGTIYDLWKAPGSGSITFYTEKPNINGSTGDDSGNEPEGTPMGTFEADAETQTVTAPSNGYLLLTYDSAVNMTGAGGAALFSHASYGPDMAISAIETNGEPTGTTEGAFSGYGFYTGYTNVTKALYEVTEGTIYDIWRAPGSGTITFYTEKPNIGGSGSTGGGDTGDNTEFVWDSPFKPMVGKVYSFENTTVGSILTVKTNASINEKNANDMIYGEYLYDQYLRSRVTTETTANSDGSYTAGADGYITVTYKLTSKQDYYFKCPVAGEYIFSLDTSDPYEAMDPSTATPYFAAPMPGVTAFYNFVVCWEIDGVDQDLTEGKMGGATITGPNEKNIGIKNYNITTIGDGNRFIGLSINFNMDDAPKETGYYQLYLPKGIVLVDGKPNAETTIKFDYEPDNAWIPIDRELIEVTPSPDKYYNSIDGVELTFPYAIHYNDPDADYITVKVNDVEVEAEIVKGNTALSIPVEAVYSEATPYVVIEIAEQLVHDITESENPALEYTFTLAAFDNNYTLDPESGKVLTEENSTVTLTWNDCLAINLNSASDDTYDLSELGMTLVDEKGESVDLYFSENVDFYEDNGLAFDLSECAEGVYTLTIGAEAVQIVKSMGGGFGNVADVAVNNTIEATYYIGENAGVKEIQKIENLVAPVYNLQGVKVADSINGLPEGIYIIKGKKIYVR